MADDDDWDGNAKRHSRSDSDESDRRNRDRDQHKRRHRDSDHSRGDASKRNRRRSRSRSGSRERTSRRRDGSQHDDRRHEDSSNRSSRRARDYEHEEERGKRDSRDDEGQRNERISGSDWRSKLTSIRDAHFNRSKQAPTRVQNQFKNDGSFLEMFKRKMAEQSAKGEDKSSLTPNSLVLASSSIQFSPDLSLPPLTTVPIEATSSSSSGAVDPLEDLDGVPIPAYKPLPVPVSVGKRRLAKPLKTGVVVKKPQEPEEDEASEEKLDAWSRYLQEVQKYKSSNCIDEDNSRPLVK